MRILISKDAITLSENAAAWITDHIRYVLGKKVNCSVVLSGGNTPEKLYSLLASARFNKLADWSRVEFFWGDERFVPPDDPRSNAKMAMDHLLLPLGIKAAHIHNIPTTPDPVTAAAEYERTIRNYFRDQPIQFDLVLLGLGDNAHTLSLFPGYPVARETTKLVDSFFLEEQQQARITMTAPVVNEASAVLFLVSGTGKAKAMQQVFSGPADPDQFPGQLIQPVHGRLFVFADTAAASLL